MKNLLIITALTVLSAAPPAAAQERAAVFPFKRHGLQAAVVVLSQPETELWIYFYFPQIKKAPLVLILPMLGGRNLWVEEQLAAALARRGVAAAIVPLPQQFERRYLMDLPSGFLFIGRSPATLVQNLKQSLEDTGKILDWLHSQRPWPEKIDPDRIGILGVSLGGIVSSMAMARRPQIRCGAFLLAGSDLAGILTQGTLTRRMAASLGISKEQLSQVLAPYELQKGEKWERPVLLVEAIWDKIIPKASRRQLRQAIPNAEVIKVPAGHLSSILHLFWIKEKVARFFAENLK